MEEFFGIFNVLEDEGTKGVINQIFFSTEMKSVFELICKYNNSQRRESSVSSFFFT